MEQLIAIFLLFALTTADHGTFFSFFLSDTLTCSREIPCPEYAGEVCCADGVCCVSTRIAKATQPLLDSCSNKCVHGAVVSCCEYQYSCCQELDTILRLKDKDTEVMWDGEYVSLSWVEGTIAYRKARKDTMDDSTEDYGSGYDSGDSDYGSGYGNINNYSKDYKKPQDPPKIYTMSKPTPTDYGKYDKKQQEKQLKETGTTGYNKNDKHDDGLLLNTAGQETQRDIEIQYLNKYLLTLENLEIKYEKQEEKQKAAEAVVAEDGEEDDDNDGVLFGIPQEISFVVFAFLCCALVGGIVFTVYRIHALKRDFRVTGASQGSASHREDDVVVPNAPQIPMEAAPQQQYPQPQQIDYSYGKPGSRNDGYN